VFAVDGVAMLTPDADVELNEQDLDGASAGRDEAGYMHRVLVRSKVRTWSFTYSLLTAQELTYLQELFAGKATFRFSFDGGECAAYCARRSVSLHDRSCGLYKALRFDIIEC
jgi:hypothetical protein